MKTNSRSRMRAGILRALLLLVAAMAAAQPWSAILSPSRAADWTKAGLPPYIVYGTGGTGGSLNYGWVTGGVACDGTSANCIELPANPWTPPTRVQSGATITCANTGADVTTLNNALTAAKPGSYVLFQGTCSITGNLNMKNGVTLRGAGPMAALLKFSSGAITYPVPSFGTAGALSGTPAGNASTITVVSANGNPSPGGLARISQCNNGFTGWTGFQGSPGSNCATGSYSDNLGLFICGGTSACVGTPTPPWNNQDQGEVFLVTARSGDCTTASPGCNLTIFPPLLMPNWTPVQDAHVQFASPASIGAGLEDASVIFNTGSGSYFNMTNAYALIVKGNRILGATTSIFNVSAVNGLVLNNYISGKNPGFLASGLVEPFHRTVDYSSLFLNNILVHGTGFYGLNYLGGEVVAYNFTRDSDGAGPEPYINNCHGGGDCNKDLIEGNQAPQIDAEDVHTTSNFETNFRNNISGWDGPFWGPNPDAVNQNSFQRFFNYVGNVLGDSTRYAGGPRTTQYEPEPPAGTGLVWTMPWNFAGASDTLTRLSTLRWGNYDTVSGTTRWCGPGDASYPACGNAPFHGSEMPDSATMPSASYPNSANYQNATPGNRNLPCSFFLSASSAPCSVKYSGGSGLPFWKVATAWSTFPTAPTSTTTPPFPPAGPDVTGGPYSGGHAYDIPAAVAYKYLPIDASLQNSYSITSSSWSNTSCSSQAGMTVPGPCEVLTVNLGSTVVSAGNINSLIGGFQLSGVNAACIPAGTPANGEILMSGSTFVSGSTVTVVYALAGNPGVQCTGTMLYPTTRQFDERVYQVDTSGAAPVVTLDAVSHSFGNQTVGVPSTGFVFNLQNSGSSVLSITSITPSGDFAYTSNCPISPSTLGIGSSCTITATFTPTAVGARSGSILIADNAADTPQTISLSGTGTSAASSGHSLGTGVSAGRVIIQ